MKSSIEILEDKLNLSLAFTENEINNIIKIVSENDLMEQRQTVEIENDIK